MQRAEEARATAVATDDALTNARLNKVQKQDKNWKWVVATLLPFLEYAYGDHAITWPRLVDVARTAETRRSDHFKPWFEALGRLDEVTERFGNRKMFSHHSI